jgi:hypothetical protein
VREADAPLESGQIEWHQQHLARTDKLVLNDSTMTPRLSCSEILLVLSTLQSLYSPGIEEPKEPLGWKEKCHGPLLLMTETFLE